MTDALQLTPRPALGRRLGALTLEIGERVLVAALYYSLVERLLANFAHTGNFADLLTLASEGLVVALALIRKPAKDVSLRPQDWALAFGASFLPLLLAPAGVAALGPAWIGHGCTLRSGAMVTRSILFEYTRIGAGMRFDEMIVSPQYCVDRHGVTFYQGDDTAQLRWGDARG